MEVLTDKTAKHIINAPVEKINLSQWLFTLKDNEYQACSTAHIAGGTSEYIDGKRMSLNVEKIGENLMVQHYVEDISDRDHCRVNSISDSGLATPNGHSKIGVTWELKVTKVSETSCEFSNRVVVRSTEQFLASLAKTGITDLEPIKIRMFKNLEFICKSRAPSRNQ